MIEKGVDGNRLLAVGFGATKPVADANSPGNAANTRAVFAVAALNGRAVGGLSLDGGGNVADEAHR